VAGEIRATGEPCAELLASLAARLSEATGELARLRGVLVALRARTDEVRELSPS
jgi:hypothetical protein